MKFFEINYLINDKLTHLFIEGQTKYQAVKNFKYHHGNYLITNVRQVVLNDKNELEYLD